MPASRRNDPDPSGGGRNVVCIGASAGGVGVLISIATR